jgi:hypothetical protein
MHYMVQLSRGILSSNGNTAILTKAYPPLQPFSAPIHNYNTPLLLTPPDLIYNYLLTHILTELQVLAHVSLLYL